MRKRERRGVAGARGRGVALSTPAQGRWMGRGRAKGELCARRAQLQFGGGRGEGRSVLLGWVVLGCKLLDGLWVLGQFII